MSWSRPLLRAAALAAASTLVACSSSSSGSPDAGAGFTPPPLAEETAFTHVVNIFLTEVDVDGTKGLLGVDTGDPFAYLTAAAFPSAPTSGSVGTFDVGSMALTDVPVVTAPGAQASPDPEVPLGGLLGCQVLCSYKSTFDYKSATFTLGGANTPSGVGPEQGFPFTLKGGGSSQLEGQPVTIPRSRILVDVVIEGTKHVLLLDTGASAVTVDQQLFSELTKDGRATLMAGMVDTTQGASVPSYTRAKTIAVGSSEVSSVVVAHDGSFDTILGDVSAEVGETVEGSLGGTFLENFFLTIDYPGSAFHLAPYKDTSFIVDMAQNLGIGVATVGASGAEVSVVLQGSDAAAKGVSVGDLIVSVDGTDVSKIGLSQLVVLMSGKVGSTKSVRFGAAKTLANETVPLAIYDALPLP